MLGLVHTLLFDIVAPLLCKNRLVKFISDVSWEVLAGIGCPMKHVCQMAFCDLPFEDDLEMFAKSILVFFTILCAYRLY